jgi:hypothetical protein
VPEVRDACAGYKAHVTSTNHRNTHVKLSTRLKERNGLPHQNQGACSIRYLDQACRCQSPAGYMVNIDR